MHRIVDSRCVLAVRDLKESTRFYMEFGIRTPDGHRMSFGEPVP
jgi:hypothetical protein